MATARSSVPATAGSTVAETPVTLASGSTLTDRAYAEVRRRIVTVELAPGAPFSETDLAEALSIGKTPVREALARLRNEGLVQVQPRSGYKVTDVTLQDARDICELRTLLDGDAARAAAGYGEYAARYLRSVDQHPERGDGKGPGRGLEPIEADHAFHLELARVGGNARLEEALDRVLLLFGRLSHLSIALDPRVTVPAHEHSDLISAIATGDAEQARDLVVNEVRRYQALIVDSLLSSESVTKANVDVRGSFNKFYLDIPTTPER